MNVESLVQMTPALVLGALIAGWRAEAIARGTGYAFRADVVVGLAGSIVVGVIVGPVIWRTAGVTAPPAAAEVTSA